MATPSVDIKAFVDHQWREIDNGALVHAFRSKSTKLTDAPTLIIGIGGTGAAAARTVKRKVEQHYHPQEAERLEYLFIDTDEASVAGLKGSDTLIIQSADTAVLLRECKERDSDCNTALSPEIKQWLDPELSPFRVMNGAAGIRQAGRLILFLNIDRVYHTLQQKLDKVAVGRDLQNTRIKVHIFTGIGGGTGSGMFVDISYLIRSLRPNCEIQGFVFMPDVSCMKPGLHDVHRRNIKRNAWAALREIEQLMTMESYEEEKFEQTYPKELAQICTSSPVFDFCILVGSMQNGRRAVCSEKEILERTAEYLLLELHQKEPGGFDFESHKSNLCVQSGTDYYFTRYVAVDAAAKYLPVDFYYSWWLNDVLQLICDGLKAPFSEKDGIIKEIGDNIDTHWGNIQDKAANRNELSDTLEQFLQEQIRNHDTPPKSLAAKLNLLGDHAEKAQNEIREYMVPRFIRRKKSKKGQQAPKGGLIKPLKWGNTVRHYRLIYNKDNSYKPVLEKIATFSTQFSHLMREIQGKCQKYADTKLPSSFFPFTEVAFQLLHSRSEYTDSVNEAALKIVNDFLQNSDLWLGHKLSSTEDCLADHVAALVCDEFAKSGCASIYKLLKYSTQAGAPAVQSQFEETVLNELHAAQLWPIKSGVMASTLKDYSIERILAYPDEPAVQRMTEEWCEKAKEEFSPLPTRLHDRVVMGIYASGYSLRSYEGIDNLEREYNKAANRAGSRLYAGERTDWNRPFSPLFGYDWSDSTDTQEQKTARAYRKVFERALNVAYTDSGIAVIHYDDKLRKYVFQPPGDVEAEPIGIIEEDDCECYKRYVFEVFIRRPRLIEAVKKALQDPRIRKDGTDGNE